MKRLIILLAAVILFAAVRVNALTNDVSATNAGASYNIFDHLYGRGFLFGGGIIGFGADYQYAPFGWAGLNFIITTTVFSGDITRSVLVCQAGIETGVHIIRNQPRHINAGVGLNLNYYFVADRNTWQTLTTNNNSSGIIAGVFLNFEWRYAYARLYMTYQPGSSQPFLPYPMIGIKF